MKNSWIFIALFWNAYAFGQNSLATFESRASFYPEYKHIHEDKSIAWGFLTVPENWAKPAERQIKLAVAILSNTSGHKNAGAILMIEGGPGAGTIEGMGWWLNHPLRKENDIILLDTRGTGFSEPRLCPDLGKSLLKILAKNQEEEVDEKEKANLAMACKQDLIARGVDMECYQSPSIVHDFHALKEHFKYQNWKVYGVSYGTYIAQVYANTYPEDVKALILDSPISDISKYYTQNTSNYLSGLENMFADCKASPDCVALYPDLEKTYYETIAQLEKDPITVAVDKSIVPTGEFTYNAEDFKIAIHQALYQKILVEVLPMLIQQFHDRNEQTLGALVAAFSQALRLDYGVYYCTTCNEVIPKNDVGVYVRDAQSHPLLSGGLSFYKSDFVVCDKWNQSEKLDISSLQNSELTIEAPTLIIAGEYDPITPLSNGQALLQKIKNAQLIEAKTFGHASGFSRKGLEITNNFFSNPNDKIQNTFDKESILFVTNVQLNGGVVNLGNSLNEGDLLFFIPLGIGLLLALGTILAYLFKLFIKSKKEEKAKYGVGILLSINSILALVIISSLILATVKTADYNFYILAFGLPESYAFVFQLLFPYLIMVLCEIAYLIYSFKSLRERSLIFSVVFSHALILIYLNFWGFFAFE